MNHCTQKSENEELLLLLHKENHSCVIKNQGKTRSFSQRGVADLYHLLNHDVSFLKGATVADKIVGKAAAALMILGGVKTLHAGVISFSALELLQDKRIEVSYEEAVPFILNRDQTDWCPLEKLCDREGSPENVLLRIKTFINKIKN